MLSGDRTNRTYRADLPIVVNDIEHELMITNQLLAKILERLTVRESPVVLEPPQTSRWWWGWWRF